MAAEVIARRHDFFPWKKKFKGEIAEGSFGDQKIIALKPQTFMNLSGESVQAAADFYKIAPEHIIVLYDELDLAPNKIRVKKGGGAGGHNGIRSIDQHLGTEYWRVRLGIGHPGDKNLVTPYVLGNFFAEEKEGLEKLLDAVAEHAPRLVQNDMDGFMSKVAETLQPPKIKPVKTESKS